MYNHTHGGNIVFSNKEKNYIDFSVNTNPFGCPDVVKKMWDSLIDKACLYPSIDAKGVSIFYEKRFGIDRQNLVAGNGSIEILYLIPSALNIKSVLLVEPSFYDYRYAFEINGCKINSCFLNEENEFKFETDRCFLDKLNVSDCVVLANPNNPTARMIDRDVILNLAESFKDKIFIIDEAFGMFLENYDDITLAKSGLDNIIVLHSLTKIYALAGLRIGSAIGNQRLIDKIKERKPPWSVNALAEEIAIKLSECGDYERKTLKFLSEEKKRIMALIKQSKIIKLFDSDANFFLAKFINKEGFDDFLKYLWDKNIYVRDCRNFNGLNGNFFRFAVLKREYNDRLINAILEYF